MLCVFDYSIYRGDLCPAQNYERYYLDYITYNLRILVVFSVIVLIEYNIDPTLENLYSLHTN